MPTNLRESRAFVGLCQYYRRFVPKFSEIAAPLHAVTKKDARFVWSADCQQAFDALKNALVGADVGTARSGRNGTTPHIVQGQRLHTYPNRSLH